MFAVGVAQLEDVRPMGECLQEERVGDAEHKTVHATEQTEFNVCKHFLKS